MAEKEEESQRSRTGVYLNRTTHRKKLSWQEKGLQEEEKQKHNTSKTQGKEIEKDLSVMLLEK